jgi:hypothetical protein
VGDDDERGADDAGKYDAHQHRRASPGIRDGEVVRGPVERIEVKERRDQQQYRCSDHHAVASSEGADIHFVSFISRRLVFGGGVAVTMSPYGRGVKRGGGPSS